LIMVMTLLGWYVWPDSKPAVVSTTPFSATTQPNTGEFTAPISTTPKSTGYAASPIRRTQIEKSQPPTPQRVPPPENKVVKQPSDDEMARGVEPDGPPHPAINDPSLTEEQRLNKMSSTEFQDYLAGTVRKLKEFEQRWHYPETQSFDPPAEGADGTVPQNQLREYWKEVDRRQHNYFEIRPRKRFQAFKKEFPQVESLAAYLYQRWPGIQGMDNCFAQEKMLEGSAQGCAEYIQDVLNTSRRQ
jgi:hypothetical protein